LLHHRAIMLAVTLVRNLHPLIGPPIVSPPPSLQLKRKRDRETDLEIGEDC
jgi:hypothetical protein